MQKNSAIWGRVKNSSGYHYEIVLNGFSTNRYTVVCDDAITDRNNTNMLYMKR